MFATVPVFGDGSSSARISRQPVARPADVHLQRVPSYRSTISHAAEDLPAYSPLIAETSVADLEAAQVARKNSAARAQYDKRTADTLTDIAATPGPQNVPTQANEEDIERGDTCTAKYRVLTRFQSCLFGLALLPMIVHLAVGLYFPKSPVQDWSDFQINFWYNNRSFGHQQFVLVLFWFVSWFVLVECAKPSVGKGQWSTNSRWFWCFTALHYLGTTILICARVLGSLTGSAPWLQGVSREEKVAELIKLIA